MRGVREPGRPCGWALLALGVLAAAAACSSGAGVPRPRAQGARADSAGSAPTAFAGASRAADDSAFCWAGREYGLRVEAAGSALISRGQGKPTAAPAIPLERGEYVSQLWGLESDGDLLLLAQVTNGEDVRSMACRWGGEPVQQEWCLALSTFNLVGELYGENRLYVAGSDLVSRIDARSGRPAWIRDGLYAMNNVFNVFSLPTELGDAVVLDATTGVDTNYSRIAFDRESGEILGVGSSPVGAAGVRKPVYQREKCSPARR